MGVLDSGAEVPGHMREPTQLAAAIGPIDRDVWLSDLYDRHSNYVREVVARHAGPGFDPEDLVQDVFVAAYRKSGRLMGYPEPRGWLHVAALREVWAARRRHRLGRLFRLRLAAETLPTDDPESNYRNREASTLFYKLLDRLPEKQRTVFLLVQVEGYSSVEVARLVKCPEATVRTRLFHARRAFAAAAHRWQHRETAPPPPAHTPNEPKP
jgi:RNA polymerase sigma-70 factor (ECF subfamily)